MRFVNGKMWRGIVSGLLVDGKTAMLVENIADANIKYINVDKYRMNAMKEILLSCKAIHALITETTQYEYKITTNIVKKVGNM